MAAPEFMPMMVVAGKAGGYFVKSRSQDGVWWQVWERDCSCPAGRNGADICAHRRQVAAFVKALAEKNRRPRAVDSGEAVVSRFVD